MEIKKGIIKVDESIEELINPEYIIIHHTEEVGWDLYKTHQYHISLGWKCIGYNYFIEEDGIIIEGRGMKVGAHTKGMNSKSIGICLSGNFDVDLPKCEQINSLKNLCTFLQKNYNISIERVIAHREVENVSKT